VRHQEEWYDGFQSQKGETQLELSEIQGDILVGLQKDFQWFLFFEVVDVSKFKSFVTHSLLPRISSAKKVLEWESAVEDHKAAGRKDKLSLVGVNAGFSITGLEKLKAPKVAEIVDPAFKDGIAARSVGLGDPKSGQGSPATWKVGGPDNAADGVILITGPTEPTVDKVREELITNSGGSFRLIFEERGMTRQFDRGHEHFGYLDGVSQPGIRGQIDLTFPNRTFLQESQNPSDPGQSLPGSDLLWPGEFVFGYPAQNPKDLDDPSNVSSGGPDWMKNGAFMVFRRLNQLVPEFHKFARDSANPLETDPVLFEARMVGRWKSGAPLEITPLQDDPDLGGKALENNNFEFDTDPAGRRCPFAAHIRKSYPRNDVTPAGENAPTEFEQREQSEADTQTHRILRRGIPFGPDPSDDENKTNKTTTERGLLFVCYQTSIQNQFEFILQAWVNNPGFAPLGNNPGFDPLLGQFGDDPFINRVVVSRDPRPVEGLGVSYPTGNRGPTTSLPIDFIVPSGGGYFFMPSLSTFKTQFGE
jgi:Dyp-type peroxidase family